MTPILSIVILIVFLMTYAKGISSVADWLAYAATILMPAGGLVLALVSILIRPNSAGALALAINVSWAAALAYWFWFQSSG